MLGEFSGWLLEPLRAVVRRVVTEELMSLDLFRRQHENATLFQPPFTTAQVQAIPVGHTPDGSL